MSQADKILATMLSLRQFTPKELADFAGANIATVYSVLNRQRYRLNTEIRKTGKPGGPKKVFRLKAEEVDRLYSEITERFPALPQPNPSRTSEIGEAHLEDSPKILLGLEMVNNLLSVKYQKAETDSEREKILRRADIYLCGIEEEKSVNPVSKNVDQELDRHRYSYHSFTHMLEAKKIMREMLVGASRQELPKLQNAFSVVEDSMINVVSEANRVSGAFAHAISAAAGLEPDAFSEDDDSESILLIDAIFSAPSELTARMTTLLQSVDKELRVLKMLENPENMERLMRQNRADICVVTINSQSNPLQLRPMINNVMRLWKEKDKFHILDQHANSKVHDIVKAGHVNYVSYAQDLKPESLLVELKLGDFAGRNFYSRLKQIQ